MAAPGIAARTAQLQLDHLGHTFGSTRPLTMKSDTITEIEIPFGKARNEERNDLAIRYGDMTNVINKEISTPNETIATVRYG